MKTRRSLTLAVVLFAAPAWMLDNDRPPVVTTFDFTGQAADYVVPAGVCKVRIAAVGAAGGPAGTSGVAGAGARASTELTVTPGETLHVRVGGWGGGAMGSTPGAGGWNGGGAGGDALAPDGKAGSGGGGATDVRRGGDQLEHRIVVAAGGAGGAGGGIGGTLGSGGGNGGDPVGHRGFALVGSANPASGGAGGTHTRGYGGDGGAGSKSGGGGGGAGLHGGEGGSGSSFSGGHGGGGSSMGPSRTDFHTGANDGFGRATISYDPSSPC